MYGAILSRLLKSDLGSNMKNEKTRRVINLIEKISWKKRVCCFVIAKREEEERNKE